MDHAVIGGTVTPRAGAHGARDCNGEPLAPGDIAQVLGIRKWVLITGTTSWNGQTYFLVDSGPPIWGPCLKKGGVGRAD